MNTNKDDNELIKTYRKTGRMEILGILFKRYYHLVFGLSLKYLKDRDEAKDQVMEIFEKLETDLKRFEITNFKSWLFTTTKNQCLMALRKNKSRGNKESLDNVMEIPSLEHHNDKLELEKNLNALEACIEKLNKEQKLCIQLFYLKKNSYDSIVNTTKYDLKKVKSYVQNGKRNLKICLENG